MTVSCQLLWKLTLFINIVILLVFRLVDKKRLFFVPAKLKLFKIVRKNVRHKAKTER